MNSFSGVSAREVLLGLVVEVVELALEDRDDVTRDVLADLGVGERPLAAVRGRRLHPLKVAKAEWLSRFSERPSNSRSSAPVRGRYGPRCTAWMSPAPPSGPPGRQNRRRRPPGSTRSSRKMRSRRAPARAAGLRAGGAAERRRQRLDRPARGRARSWSASRSRAASTGSPRRTPTRGCSARCAPRRCGGTRPRCGREHRGGDVRARRGGGELDAAGGEGLARLDPVQRLGRPGGAARARPRAHAGPGPGPIPEPTPDPGPTRTRSGPEPDPTPTPTHAASAAPAAPVRSDRDDHRRPARRALRPPLIATRAPRARFRGDAAPGPARLPRPAGDRLGRRRDDRPGGPADARRRLGGPDRLQRLRRGDRPLRADGQDRRRGAGPRARGAEAVLVRRRPRA